MFFIVICVSLMLSRHNCWGFVFLIYHFGKSKKPLLLWFFYLLPNQPMYWKFSETVLVHFFFEIVQKITWLFSWIVSKSSFHCIRLIYYWQIRVVRNWKLKFEFESNQNSIAENEQKKFIISVQNFENLAIVWVIS